MVHNSGVLLEVVGKDPNHPFASIPILCNNSLLGELKKPITSEPSERIRMVTEIPPHVDKIESLTALIRQERVDRLENYENIKVAVEDGSS